MARSWMLHTILSVWLISTIYVLADTAVEGQTPVGATRIYPKTSFTCKNRPAGYYADMETGCQIYHMCDGLGREFSYSCPNTTLFQQRMLICDHWYMVNCSKAGDDYSANLLIGQKDKPFVPESEYQQRTPRPDLLDRPYAPDYSGESFRNQYKDLPPIQNHIADFFSKKEFSKPQPTRWSLKNSLKAKDNNAVFSNNRRNDNFEDNNNSNNSNNNNNNNNSDLGTSHSTRYNTSGDFSNEHSDAPKPTDFNTIVETTKRPQKVIKTPSKIYEPPFLYPVYNQNYTTTTESLTTPTTDSPTTTTRTTTTKLKTITIRTTEATTTPTFITEPSTTVTETASTNQFTGSTFDSTAAPLRTSGFATDNRPTTLQQILTQPTQRILTVSSTARTTFGSRRPDPLPPLELPHREKIPLGLPAEPIGPRVPLPPQNLLPPLQEYVVPDVATTQGPPIYYEWKTPSDSLQPPKLPEGEIPKPQNITTTTTTTTATPDLYAGNPFLSSLIRAGKGSNEEKTSRSINGQTKRLAISDGHGNEILVKPPIEMPSDDKIEELQRELLIPDFIFPLENEGRTGYEIDDSRDSFQLKIKRKRNARRYRRQTHESRQKRQTRRV